MKLRNVVRRWARSLGLISYGPLTCRSCGHRIDFAGDRREQASRAIDHFEYAHNWESQSERQGA